MIHTFAQKRDAKSCKYFYDKARLEGVSPRLSAYSDLIDVFVNAEMYPEAMTVFSDMRAKEMQPDQGILNKMLEVGTKTQDVALIMSCARELLNMGIEPGPEHSYYVQSLRDL